MRTALANVLLAIVWTAARGTLTLATLLEGFVFGYLVLWLASGGKQERSAYYRKLPLLLGFTAFMLRELVGSALRVAWDVVTPTHHMRPSVLGVPLAAKTDAEITLLSNLLSLTPGTLMVDLSEDRQVLYMHTMFAHDEDQVRRHVKEGYERRVLELLR